MNSEQHKQYILDLIEGLQENGDPVSVEAARELQNLQHYREASQEAIGCFHAAEAEGLSQALQETTDERLKDLVERRLMYALHAAQEAQKHEASEESEAQDCDACNGQGLVGNILDTDTCPFCDGSGKDPSP
jgi:DnaJ-class molecular chaperone